MESIEFVYSFTNEDKPDDLKRVIIRKSDEGLCDTDLCDAFVDFMTSAGFAEQNIYDYFHE